MAVISGRPAHEAKEMVGMEGLVYVGCHGMERLSGGNTVVAPMVQARSEQLRRTARVLAKRLTELPEMEGLFVEDKGISTTFHYRGCRYPEVAHSIILDMLGTIRGLDGLRIMEARRAVELLPDIAADKGTALMGLASEFGLRGVFYLGDDSTDVSAFRAIRQWRERTRGMGFAVAVTGEETPADVLQEADFTLPGVPGAERFLGLLRQLSARLASGGPPSADRAREQGPPPPPLGARHPASGGVPPGVE